MLKLLYDTELDEPPKTAGPPLDGGVLDGAIGEEMGEDGTDGGICCETPSEWREASMSRWSRR